MYVTILEEVKKCTPHRFLKIKRKLNPVSLILKSPFQFFQRKYSINFTSHNSKKLFTKEHKPLAERTTA